MTVQELMNKGALRDRLSDSLESGYEDAELIAYINDAINFIWHVLIDNDYYEVIGDHTFTEKTGTVPDDWYRVTNQAPIIVRGNQAEVYGDLPQVIRYYKRPKFVSAVGDQMPFSNEAFCDIVIQLVVILAMANHGFNMDVEQDVVEAIIKLL